MGSWSVYCGISNITITSGRKCVFLPLQKNKSYESYDKNIPATLPIFGEYNDYGSLENIVDDFNTKLIEETYGCSIQEFVDFIVDGRRDYGDKYSEWFEKEHLKPLEDFTYMWIDGEIYNFMSNLHPRTYDRVGDFDMGNSEILKELGFVYIGESGVERYNQKYLYTKDNISVELVSDGTWAHHKDNNGGFTQLVYSISTLKELGVDVSKFEGMEIQNIHRILSVKDKYEKLGYIIGIRRDFFINMKSFQKFVEGFSDKLTLEDKDFFKNQTLLNEITRKYAELIPSSEELCDRLADLVTIRKNMHFGSYTWSPYILFLTPQCGEFEGHQLILDGFSKIHGEILKEYLET